MPKITLENKNKNKKPINRNFTLIIIKSTFYNIQTVNVNEKRTKKESKRLTVY